MEALVFHGLRVWQNVAHGFSDFLKMRVFEISISDGVWVLSFSEFGSWECKFKFADFGVSDATRVPTFQIAAHCGTDFLFEAKPRFEKATRFNNKFVSRGGCFC